MVSKVDNTSTSGQFGRLELDSHADTIVAGANCVVLSYTGRECDVTPYDSTYAPAKGVPIVHAATGWQSPFTGQIYTLVLNESLWMPKLPNTLVNPNQLRHYGIQVQDNPFSDFPLSIKTEDLSFSMPLESQGTVIFAHTFSPSAKDLENNPRIILSSDHQWEPSKVKFPKPPNSLAYEIQESSGGNFSVSAIISKLASLPYDNDSNRDVLDNLPTQNVYSSGKRHADVSSQELSERWFISPKQAIKTLGKNNPKIFKECHPSVIKALLSRSPFL